jgi:hypothetical protein
MLSSTERLADDERARWLLQGRAAVPALIAFVESWPGSADDDHARGHAADLLADLGAREAIPFLLSIYVADAAPEQLVLHLERALPRFGEGLIEPAVSFMRTLPPDGLAISYVCQAVAATGVRSERVFGAIASAFRLNDRVAEAFAIYGDPRALPLVEERLRTFTATPGDLSDTSRIEYLVHAYGELGGVLDGELRTFVAYWQLHNTAALLGYSRLHREVGHAPDMRRPEVRAAVRRLAPSVELVVMAEPALAELGSDRSLEALELAEQCARIARLEEPLREAAIVETSHAALARTLVARFQALSSRERPS